MLSQKYTNPVSEGMAEEKKLEKANKGFNDRGPTEGEEDEWVWDFFLVWSTNMKENYCLEQLSWAKIITKTFPNMFDIKADS